MTSFSGITAGMTFSFIDALERSGVHDLAKGQKVFFDNWRSGKRTATNIRESYQPPSGAASDRIPL